MKIAIDITPLNDARLLSHRVRGTGFYLENLKKSLVRYFPENSYNFFKERNQIDKNAELIHYPYFEPFFLTLPLFERYKRIVTVHDLTPLVFPKNFPSGVKGNVKWQIQKLNLFRSARILTDSESSKKDISKIAEIPEDKIDVAYLGASEVFKKMEQGKPASPASPNRGKPAGGWKIELQNKYALPDKFVLYVGDVTWNKNLPSLIKAANKTNISLVMVGKALTEKNFDRQNPWNQDLAETQKLVAESSNVKLLGFVPVDDLVKLYNTATAFVMPSLYEGFGLPILEAMQSGCPVITTKAGSLPEVAGNAALYVDAEDIESIADGLSEVFEDEKLQSELSKKGLAQAKKFSWEKTAEKTITSYRKALEL